MHFWIDKPAGRYYGFSGRRYPAMSFPKTHFTGQHRRCGNQDVTRLQMVTPVHRFQTISTGGNSAGPSNLNSNRSLRPNIQNSNNNNNNNNNNNINNSNNSNNNNNNSSSSYSSNNITSGIHAGVQLGQDNFNNNNATNSAYNQQVLPPTSAANRGLLNFSEFNDAEMAGYRLRCSVWIIFVLATGFVAAAKFYFDHQGAGLEVLVFCGLLVILLMSGCFYSIICRRTQNEHRQESQVDSIATVTVANTIPNESIRQVAIPVRQNPPPPYHIAILIPPPTSSDEAPPPAYDKIVQ